MQTSGKPGSPLTVVRIQAAAWFPLYDKEDLCCLLQHGRLSLCAGLASVCVCVCVCVVRGDKEGRGGLRGRRSGGRGRV